MEARDLTTGPTRKRKRAHMKRIPLWQFLHFVLHSSLYHHLACWIPVAPLYFRICSPEDLAVLWGTMKGKSNMTYAKLARAIRYYYGKGIIEKVYHQDFMYCFILSRKTYLILQPSLKSVWNIDVQGVQWLMGSAYKGTARDRLSSDGNENESGNDDTNNSLDLVTPNGKQVHHCQSNQGYSAWNTQMVTKSPTLGVAGCDLKLSSINDVFCDAKENQVEEANGILSCPSLLNDAQNKSNHSFFDELFGAFDKIQELP